MEPVRLTELLKYEGISELIIDQSCSEQHIKLLSVSLKWQIVAPHLGLSAADIEEIEYDKKVESERRLKTLQMWKEKYAYKATYRRLVEALLTVGNASHAQDVCKLLKSEKNSDELVSDVSTGVTVSTPSLSPPHDDRATATATPPEHNIPDQDQVELSTPPSFHDQHSTPETTEHGTPPPPPTALTTTAEPLEQSTTLPSEVPLPQTSPLVKRAQCFDFLLALLSAGVPHIVSIILYLVDLKTLRVAQGVSSYWWYIIEVLPRWKEEVKKNLATSPLWKQLMERRGWDKYISQEILHSESINQQYRQLYRAIVKEIHSLETNWTQGHYTLSKIETGSGVRCLQYNSKMIVSGHLDYTIKIWDKNTLQLLNTLKGHRKYVLCLQFNEEVIISGSYDHSVKVWDIQTGLIVNDLQHHENIVSTLKFNSKLVVTGSYDQTVAVWDFKSPTAITLRMVLKGHQNLVLAVDLTDTYIISGSADHSIKVWDSFNGRLLHTLQHSDYVWSLQCRRKVIISGCEDGTIRLWDLETGACLREWEGHQDAILSVAFDDNRIVTGSRHMTVKVWRMSAVLEPSSSTDALNIMTLQEHSDWVNGVQFDNFELVSGGDDGMIYLHKFIDLVSPHHNHGD